MEDIGGKIVLPGDVLFEINPSRETSNKFIIGPGLRRESDKILACKAGIVRVKDSKVYYIDNHQKRYVPVRGENVIGIVVKRGTDDLLVDIGSSELAVLPLLAFEGASKRNKPMIKVGQLVYAKILTASRDMEPELICVNSYGMSDGLGALGDEGFFITVSLEYSRKLLSPKCFIWQQLGEKMKFQSAIGINGRIWVNASTIENTMLLVQAISVLEYSTEEEVRKLCDRLFA